MMYGSAMSFFAAAFSALLACGVLARRRTTATWSFAAGMLIFAAGVAFGGMALTEIYPEHVALWHRRTMTVLALLPLPWLIFSLSYARGDYQKRLSRWKYTLAVAFIIPVTLAFAGGDGLVILSGSRESFRIQYGLAAQFLNIVLLMSDIAVLANLEKTLRAAVGVSRWKIKYGVLGLGLVFGTNIYVRSESLLFSGFPLRFALIESGALLIGCIFICIALVRHGFSDIDVYPSKAVLQSSVTLLLAGGYLFVVGVLAQAAAWFGTSSFQLQSLIVLGGAAALAMLLFSDRLRNRMHAFVGRHFRRPQHDARAVWTEFSQRLSSRVDSRAYSAEAVKLVAETFQILSVTVWQFDERKDCFVRSGSTAEDERGNRELLPCPAGTAPVLAGLEQAGRPFELDHRGRSWIEPLAAASRPRFKSGGSRICLSLKAGGRVLGAITLMDRVNAVPFSVEELDLLKCIGEQVAAGLLQFKLSEELLQSRELEAFQTMSTFFVHDLKNAGSSLSLMLKNLPVHFDDPAFRKDALRGIGSAVDRINQIILRLGTFRQQPAIKPVKTNLSHLVSQVVDGLALPEGVDLVRELQPVPEFIADREQLESVVTNLLLNGIEALPSAGGRITVRTSLCDDRAALSVEDTGCGMSPAFVRESLFRPFRSTKKKGLGIGMFQCRAIVDAHRGSIRVESEPGQGTTFQVLLPLNQGIS